MSVRDIITAAAGAAAATDSVYVEDVFSTYVYDGKSVSQTITNGIDLATKGGMVWTKARSTALPHEITDTVRGFSPNGYAYSLSSNTTDAQSNYSDVTSFNTTGFSLGRVSDNGNSGGNTYASWTFRKQPKFFDIVTYTGNGVAGRQIPHALGSTPGMIIIKSTSLSTENWIVYHRSLGGTKYLFLNTTGAANTASAGWYNTNPTSTVFTVSSNDLVNKNGATYVAYLFAHDAGGFGAAGTDSVVSCGSYTTNGSAYASVNLGWEPQFLLMKRSDGAGNWRMLDTMRGNSVQASSGQQLLYSNLSNAEQASSGYGYPTSTGFIVTSDDAINANFIYLAIRRGPMKTPTDATKVFSSLARTGTGSSATVTGVGFSPDFIMSESRSLFDYNAVVDRLRGAGYIISPQQVGQENNNTANGISAITMDGFNVGSDGTYGSVNFSGIAYSIWFLKRAPGFFDVVCYQATGVSNRQINHNLGVTPELMIVKDRTASGTWFVYTPIGIVALNDAGGTSGYNGAAAFGNGSSVVTPTSTVFTVGTSANWSTNNYVAYLFASCPGVSKVGSYTGSGTTKQIDCGFAAGARFVLIKRTDGTGDWYVWDTARGIVSGNDPYLLLNAKAAEVTNTDYIDPYSAGFEISSSAPAAINASGGTFIYLAIA
jgi:hypothetical protein